MTQQEILDLIQLGPYDRVQLSIADYKYESLLSLDISIWQDLCNLRCVKTVQKADYETLYQSMHKLTQFLKQNNVNTSNVEYVKVV